MSRKDWNDAYCPEEDIDVDDECCQNCYCWCSQGSSDNHEYCIHPGGKPGKGWCEFWMKRIKAKTAEDEKYEELFSEDSYDDNDEY